MDALDAFAAPVTYSTCVPGQACYGTDGLLTTSASVAAAAAPTPDLEPNDDPSTTTDTSASGSAHLAVYASPLIPVRYNSHTLVRQQVDGVPPLSIDGIANGWNPTAVTGTGSDGYRPIPGTGTAGASRTLIWIGNFVPTTNDFISTRWQESQTTWTRRPDLLKREPTPTIDVTIVDTTPTSEITLATSLGEHKPTFSAISNPATAGATTILDPNATSSTPSAILVGSSATLLLQNREKNKKPRQKPAATDFHSLQPWLLISSRRLGA